MALDVARVLLRENELIGECFRYVLNNERYMQKRGKQAGKVAAVIVSIALLAAPLCSIACADTSFFAFLTTETVERGSQSHHCHQSSAQPDNQTTPPPEHHSHHCADHQAALLFTVNGTFSALSSIVLIQPYLPVPFTALLTNQPQARHRGWRDSLKAPPHPQQRAILRI